MTAAPPGLTGASLTKNRTKNRTQALVAVSMPVLRNSLASRAKAAMVSALSGSSRPAGRSQALENGLTVAIRNVLRFAPTGVPTLSPLE